jgi:large subunit ribosomal protein L4
VQLAALRSALSAKYAQDQLVIVDALQMNEHKTRVFVDIVRRHHWMNRSLLLTTGRSNVERNLRIASNNVPRVECTRAEELDVYRMLQYDLLILDRVAVEALEEKLKLD